MKNHAPIICHHCGMDYAHEYWVRPAADPFVCFSCRRDTNPEAADAPQWTPQLKPQEAIREQVVTEARKQCRVCRGEYVGRILGPAPSKGSPLPFGICDPCGVAEDRADKLATAPVVPYAVAVRE